MMMVLHRAAACASFVLAISCLVPVSSAETKGEFVGKLVLEDIDLESGRDFRLVEPFGYKDPHGVLWEAKAGTMINGASIPRPLWTIVGSPYTGLYRRASVIHDYYCTTKEQPWEKVHTVFYDAMLTAGVHPYQAKLMYYAVWRFGPRWTWHLARSTRYRIDRTTGKRITEQLEVRRPVVERAILDKATLPKMEKELRAIEAQIKNEDPLIDNLVALAKSKPEIKRLRKAGPAQTSTIRVP